MLPVFSLYAPCVFPVCSLCFPCVLPYSTFSYQNQKLLKIMQNGCWQKQFCVSRIYLVNWKFSFPKRLVRFCLPKQQHFGDFHDFKDIFMTSSTLFITKSTFSHQKAQKTKVAQNYAKYFLVGPILCFAYIFGELGVFLSKTVSQVQFTKTIVFWRLS